MLLSVFTRHSTGCKFSRDRARRLCSCPNWLGGEINGYYFRQSARTREWADAIRQQLEEALAKGLPPFGSAMATAKSTRSEAAAPPTPPEPSTETPAVPSHEIRPKPRPDVTVAQAVDAYLADDVSRSVEVSTLKKLEAIFANNLSPGRETRARTQK